MSTYGIKILDDSGNAVLLTPKLSKIVGTGTLTMPNVLNGDGTYGTDVVLPEADMPLADLGVIVQPAIVHWYATIASWEIEYAGTYPFTWYADDSATYYTKNSATGVMTAWTAGAMTPNAQTTWDPACNCFPLAGWDYLTSETEFTNIRIWAAMAHIVYDTSATTYQAVYTIGDHGVETVNYMIFLKNH